MQHENEDEFLNLCIFVDFDTVVLCDILQTTHVTNNTYTNYIFYRRFNKIYSRIQIMSEIANTCHTSIENAIDKYDEFYKIKRSRRFRHCLLNDIIQITQTT